MKEKTLPMASRVLRDTGIVIRCGSGYTRRPPIPPSTKNESQKKSANADDEKK